MIRSFMIFLTLTLSVSIQAQHNAGNNGKVLMIASNAATSAQTGWPIGVWFAELTHPYWVFSDAGYTVDIATPDGGDLQFDQFSDPEDASKYAAFDYISLGFKKDPSKMALTRNTLKLSSVNADDYKAIFVCGGQGPMYTFIDNKPLHDFFTKFYLTGKPTAAICHGTCILLQAKLPNGKFLAEGKRWTGFASSEEEYADNYVGKQIQPFRIEDAARKMPESKFETGAPFSSYAVADGNLITGQQQNSGSAAAELVVKAIEKDRARYPTYVLVHGAWADESAWSSVRNQLAVGANVVVVNLAGHGIDLTPANKISMDSYVKQLIRVVNAQPGKVRIVGHSMAGAIISQVAERIPLKIDKLIYVSAYLPTDKSSILSLSSTDTQSKVGGALEFSADGSAASIKKDVIPDAVCADCPEPMKALLIKYHKAEPVRPLADTIRVSATKFGTVPKFYIATTNDQAVGYELQHRMIKSNGTVKKVYTMPTSHLSFLVQPELFLKLIKEIN